MPESCIVVLPAYNEQDCIRDVCLEWLSAIDAVCGQVLVVDDGSTDATPSTLDQMAAAHPALRVVHQANAGHGAAILHGYREALCAATEWIFQVDSDRQFDSADFSQLWLRRGEAPFLLGVRAHRNDHPVRLLLSRLHQCLVNAVFGVDVVDPNSPFRLMRASRLARWLDYVPGDAFAPNVLLSILARRENALVEVPVRHLPRLTGKVSIRGLRTLRIAALWIASLARFRRRQFRHFVRKLATR